MKKYIPVSEPLFGKNAKKYLAECITTGWISSKGPFVSRFEKAFAKYIGVKYAVATSSGTSALHLALAALGVGHGDEVIVPTLTMIASVLPILYQNARPVLIDSEKETGNIDPEKIKSLISKKTKAIIVVHLHGHPTNLDPILNIARENKIPVIEDAAESHGARYKNKIVGSLGDLACFSFYGNKILAVGEGGMVTTNNKKLAEQIRSLSNLARSPNRHFLHQKIGFAYRMSNLHAALGHAQLQEIKKFVEKKRAVARLYSSLLGNIAYLELPREMPYARSVFWQYGILVGKNSPVTRNQLEKILSKKGVETRRFFTPMHQQPIFKKLGLFTDQSYSSAEDLSRRGLCLPSGLAITDNQIKYVCQVIKNAFL